jgi:outer membrane protein TolC
VSRILSLAAVVVLSSSARAEDVKTFLDAAEQGNVDRKISIEQRNRAAAEYRQAWTSLLPSLSAQAGWTHNQYNAEITLNPVTGEKVVIIPYDQFDGALRFDLPLIDTQRWFRMSAAGASEASAALWEQVTRDLVRRQVVASFYGYAASLAVGESARKSASVAAEQLKLMEIRASVGTVTELDLLRARAEVARTRQVVADTVSLVATSRRTVRTLTGLEPPELLALPVDDVTPAKPLEEYEARIEQLPAVQAADKDAQAAGTVANASRLALVPTVGAQFTQRFTNATGFQGRAATYNAGINLTWRLDVPTFMAMQAQSANEQSALLAGDRARLQARDQVNTDWQRLQAALIKIEAARAQVEAARRATQVAKDRYNAGAATQVDVIQAERDVFGAEVSQIQARTELATARASLLISAALPLE